MSSEANPEPGPGPAYERESTACIECPQCGRRSYNSHDILEQYCGACHQYHADMPPRPARTQAIRALVAWIFTDRLGRERVLNAFIPPGSATAMICPEGDRNEAALDVIARNTARQAGVDVTKWRFVQVEELETYDPRIKQDKEKGGDGQ